MSHVALLQGSGVTAEASRPPNQKVHEAAEDFESVLLGQWLEKAEDSFGSIPGDGADADGSQMKSFAMQYLAREITKAGGIGISRMVEKGLTQAGGTGPVPPKPPAVSGNGELFTPQVDAGKANAR